MAALALLLSLLSSPASAGCGLLELYPHATMATVSNGADIPLPTQARRLVSYVLIGSLEPRGSAGRLPGGLVPLELDGHAFGALSVFDYRESDLGVFRESYFVILAGREKPVPDRLALYHIKAWSTDETARLASGELWGIPSSPAEIDVSTRARSTVFQVRAHGVPVIEMTWARLPELPNPLGFLTSVDAVGPGNGAPVFSPIRACGDSRVSRFGPGDSLVVRDRSLDVLLKALAFQPAYKILFPDEEAVQFR